MPLCDQSLNTWQDAVNFLSTELSEVSKTRYLTVKILSADFAAASKNSGKNLCCLLKINVTSSLNIRSADDVQLFFVLVMQL